MKIILPIIILLAALPCFAQPTGHQRIFLEITDNGDTLHFERNFKKNTFRSKPKLSYKKYELSDISTNKTGFAFYPSDEFIHKTLMTKDHHIQIVRNRIDTMSIEILNAFNVYFLSISFQKGKYRIVVNDGKENQRYLSTLPKKTIHTEQFVYDITPLNWSIFQVDINNPNKDYSISSQFTTKEPPITTTPHPVDRNQFSTTKKENGFRFTLDKAPLVNCPECKDCFCQLLMVFGPDSATLFNQVFTFRNANENKGIKNIEVADYNFDGTPDFQLIFPNQKPNYYVFDKNRNTFVEEPFLNRLETIEFYFKEKNFTARILEVEKIDEKLSGMYPNNERIKAEFNYFAFGSGIQFVKEIHKIYNYTNSEIRAETKTNYYRYEKYTLLAISETEYTQAEKAYSRNEIIKVVEPFKFVLEKNTPGIQLPAEKGCYANKISIFEITSNNLIFETIAVGNSLKESPGCSDSMQIADFNFDGYPDFRICHHSLAGKHTYYVYQPKRNTFIIEHTLSELNGLTFDFIQKTANGSTERKEFMGYPWNSPYQYYMEMLQFEGTALENLTVTTTIYGGSTYVSSKCKYINQKRIYEGDTLALKMQKNNFLSKEVGPFKFQVAFNPEELKTSGEKGAYVKRLEIYQGKRPVGNYEMHGNYLKEVPHWLDSLEIADYNFDGYADIRMYNSKKDNGSYSYFIFNPDKDVQQFYIESLFSFATETEYIPHRKIMKGKIVESNLTRYLFLQNDTLTITIQDNDLTKPPFIEESIYKNGNRSGIRSAYGKLEPELKKEYGDYNFDGYEDFRQQSKKNPSGWDVFIFNPKKETFIKDTLMSKFVSFNYNKLDKTLIGYYTVKDDETTRTTYYYQWSFAENKMVLYQQQVCFSKFPSGESYRCIVSRLVNGKWVETETFGAE